jgi:hypothetical protein
MRYAIAVPLEIRYRKTCYKKESSDQRETILVDKEASHLISVSWIFTLVVDSCF